jgi:hypothetical protein
LIAAKKLGANEMKWWSEIAFRTIANPIIKATLAINPEETA